MAMLSLNEYAQYLRGMAIGLSGCRSIVALVCEPETIKSDVIILRDVGEPSLPSLAISRRAIENDEAEGMVLAIFGPKPDVPVVPELVHPVVCAIRNSKPAGTYR